MQNYQIIKKIREAIGLDVIEEKYLKVLTPREARVKEMIDDGYTTKEIALHHSVTVYRIRQIRKKIQQKWNTGRCMYEFECDNKATNIHVVDGKPTPLCKEHYLEELAIDAEIYEQEHGTFCIVCGETVENWIIISQKLPCMCHQHIKEIVKPFHEYFSICIIPDTDQWQPEIQTGKTWLSLTQAVDELAWDRWRVIFTNGYVVVFEREKQ